MKGVILAGGLGVRLSPLTSPLNKHLLPVYNAPMITHVIKTLTGGGITEIMIVLNGLHPGLFLEILGDGSALGCNLTFRYSKKIGGPGRSLMLSEKWVGDEEFALILGDSLFFTFLKLSEQKAPHMFIMPIDDFDDLRKYGQVKVKGNYVKSIVWKPDTLYSNFIQTTCFVFPTDAFSRLRHLDQDTPGEVSISALSRQYVDEGKMHYTLLPPRSYIDCGTIDALHRAAECIRKRDSQILLVIR